MVGSQDSLVRIGPHGVAPLIAHILVKGCGMLTGDFFVDLYIKICIFEWWMTTRRPSKNLSGSVQAERT